MLRLRSGRFSQSATLYRHQGGFPLKRSPKTKRVFGSRSPLSPHCNPQLAPLKADSLGVFPDRTNFF